MYRRLRGRKWNRGSDEPQCGEYCLRPGRPLMDVRLTGRGFGARRS